MIKSVFVNFRIFRFKMAPHESPSSSPQTSIEEGGESSPEEGAEHTGAEGEGASEPPISLSDLLGYDHVTRQYQLVIDFVFQW